MCVCELREVTAQDVDFLYGILQARIDEPHTNISHRAMPSFEEHVAFVASRPYLVWYVIRYGDRDAGAAYISRAREVGIYVLAPYRGKGIAKSALQSLISLHPGPLLANIAPGNTASQAFFSRFGFDLVQYTYRR